MFLSGIVSDSDGFHPGESDEVKTAALSKLIDDSVLDRIHPDIIGMHPCTAVNHLFFSSLQFWIATPDSLSLPVGVADVGGINRSPSDFHTSQTFKGTNGNQTVITDSHSNHDLRL